jgi:hypothetical protein
MSEPVFTPPRVHHCTPGWEVGDEVIEGVGHVMIETGANAPDGTVIQCTCGRTYVAFYDTRPSGGWVNLGVLWRPERRFERWRRERRGTLL